MNLLLIEPHELSTDSIVALDGARAAHLRNVLKVGPGSIVRVGIVDGALGAGTVTAITAAEVLLHCTFEAQMPDRPRVDLLLALPRPKVLRRLWAQLAALGVGRIMLTNAVRVERNYFDTHLLTPEIYRPLLLEGLQQVRDTHVPAVSVHKQLKIFLEDELGHGLDAVRVFGDPASTTSITQALSGVRDSRVILAVGPEGGWTDYERQLLATHGFAPVTMGLRTLRSDTACVALLTLVHAALAEAATRA